MPCRIAAALLLQYLVTVPIAVAGTSNSLMDVSPDGTRLLVANTDNGTVTVVDTAARKALREIKVGEKPEGRHLDRRRSARRRHRLSREPGRLPRRRRRARSSRRSPCRRRALRHRRQQGRQPGLGDARVPRHASARST